MSLDEKIYELIIEEDKLTQKQTILVVGAEGFIGQHTVTRLISAGHTVYATHFARIEAPAIPEATWLPCDLTTSDFTNNWPASCDTIIYLAQSPAWRTFPEGAANVFEVNVSAALRTAEYARQASGRRFIFASSGSIYTQTVQPAKEAEVINLHQPRSFYAASKLATELLLGPYSVLFSVIILRFFVPYGPGQDPKMLIPSLVKRIQTGQPISLHGTDGLKANPTAAADVAETLERCSSLDQSATLNVAGPDILTLREIGVSLGNVLSLSPQFEVQPDQSPPVLVGDTKTLRKTLGWAPQTSFEVGARAWLQPDR